MNSIIIVSRERAGCGYLIIVILELGRWRKENGEREVNLSYNSLVHKILYHKKRRMRKKERERKRKEGTVKDN